MLKLLSSLILVGLALAQTPTTYTLPAGSVCGNGVENCILTVAGGLGRLQTSNGYWTQLQYLAYQTQNPGYDAEYCVGPAAWIVADTGLSSRLYTLSCQSRNLASVPSTMYIEVHAHSFIYSYTCGSRIRATCRQTQWVLDPGSFVTVTK